MLPKKRQSKSKVGRHRSHLALKKKNLYSCTECKGPTLPHRTCPQCGHFPRTKQSQKTERPNTEKDTSKKEEEKKSPVSVVEKEEKSVESKESQNPSPSSEEEKEVSKKQKSKEAEKQSPEKK